jgi:hypothetical protein
MVPKEKKQLSQAKHAGQAGNDCSCCSEKPKAHGLTKSEKDNANRIFTKDKRSCQQIGFKVQPLHHDRQNGRGQRGHDQYGIEEIFLSSRQ